MNLARFAAAVAAFALAHPHRPLSHVSRDEFLAWYGTTRATPDDMHDTTPSPGPDFAAPAVIDCNMYVLVALGGEALPALRARDRLPEIE